MSHTPGPWSVAICHKAFRDEAFHDETSIESAHGLIAQQVAMANAALIAAAPDLLAALRDTLAWIADYHGTLEPEDMFDDGCVSKLAAMTGRARAAIAKAEGRG